MKKGLLGAIVSVSLLFSSIIGVGAKTVDNQNKDNIKKPQVVEVKYNKAKYLCSDEPTFPPPLRMSRSAYTDEPTFPPPL